MGIKLFGNCSLYENESKKIIAPNPDPKKYTILQYKELNGYLIVKINYHTCTNYEGDKILVFGGLTISDLNSKTFIDPHFQQSAFSPIARFKPTQLGWEHAIKYVKSIL